MRSILASEYPDFEVLLVDDRSDDDTAAIGERLSRQEARLRVIHGAELPEGWYGKPWACWQGYEAAQGTVLLFTDADTVHGPQLLARAVATLQVERADLVTVMPLQEMKGFWERVSQPFFFLAGLLIIGLRFGSLRRLNRNRNPRWAVANGQFILVTRDSYGWVGGHREVRGTVIEDLMLARRYLQAGRRPFCALADRDMSTRMYATLGGIVEGWSKNLFVAAVETTGSRGLAYACTLGLLCWPAAFLAPLLALCAGLSLDYERSNGGEALLGFGAAAFVGATWLMGSIPRAVRAPWWCWVFHPVGALVTAYILLRTTWRGTRKIEWKGRTYSHP